MIFNEKIKVILIDAEEQSTAILQFISQTVSVIGLYNKRTQM